MLISQSITQLNGGLSKGIAFVQRWKTEVCLLFQLIFKSNWQKELVAALGIGSPYRVPTWVECTENNAVFKKIEWTFRKHKFWLIFFLVFERWWFKVVFFFLFFNFSTYYRTELVQPFVPNATILYSVKTPEIC